MSGIEREEDEDRYKEAGRLHRRTLNDAILRAPLAQLQRQEPLVVPDTASAQDAMRLMQQKRHGAVLVTDRGGKLRGIFTERDVLTKVAGQPLDAGKTVVTKLMTADPLALKLTDPIGFALNKMVVGGYRHVPLVDNAGKPLGVLSMRDIAQFLVEFFPEDIVNLPRTPQGAGDAADGG
jgi:CBS domain-containing protein